MVGYNQPAIQSVQAPDPTQTGAFDYNSAAAQIAQQQAYAKMLLQQGQQPQGQMVSGWYVKPHPLSQLIAAIQSGVGNYNQREAVDKQAALDKQDREVSNQAFNDYLNGPSADKLDEIKQDVNDQAGTAIYKPADPNTVGPLRPPTQPSPQAIQSAPPAIDDSMQGAPAQTQQLPTGFMPPAPAYAGTVVDPQAVADIADKRQSLLANAKAAYAQDALSRLSNTKNGAGIADRVMQAQLNAKLNPDTAKPITLTDTDGSQFLAVPQAGGGFKKVDFSNGAPSIKSQQLDIERQKVGIEDRKASAAEEQAKATREATAAQRDISNANKNQDDARANDKLKIEIDEKRTPLREQIGVTGSALDLIDRTRSLNDKYNAGGGLLSGAIIAGKVALGDTEAITLQNNLKTIGSLNAKSIFGANPSDKEQASVEAVTGSAKSGRAPTEQALKNLRDNIQAKHDAAVESDAKYAATQSKYDTAGAPQPMNTGAPRMNWTR